MTWAYWQIGLLFILTPVFTSGALTREYETGNADMLRLTLLRPREVLWGKTRAAALAAEPAIIALLIVLVPGLLIVSPDRNGLLYGYGTFITAMLCACISVACCMLAATSAKKTFLAITLAFALSALCYFGFGLILESFFPDLDMAARVFLGIPIPSLAGRRVSGHLLNSTSPLLAYLQLYGQIGRPKPQIGGWLLNVSICCLYCPVLYCFALWRLNSTWRATRHKRKWYHR